MWSPDTVDFRIVREMVGSPSQWNVKKSYSTIAKKLGVDEETVRLRLRRMRQQGYLQRWRLIPNPWLIRRRASILLIEFDDKRTKEKAVRNLQHTEGVVVIGEFYDRRISVTLFHDYPEEEVASRAQAFASTCNGRLLTFWQMEFPRGNYELTKLDWEIIEGLMENPERKLSEVADNLRVSIRTVKRRVNYMMQSYAFFLLPVVNLRKIGGVPCQLIVQGDLAKKRTLDKLIISKFDPILNFRDTGSKTHSVFGIACANVTEGEEIRRWIENQASVAAVWMNIVEQPVHVHGWLEEETREFAAQSPNVK